MIGNGSLLSSLTAVRGLELITPSILMRSVFSSLKERSALPRTLRSGSLRAAACKNRELHFSDHLVAFLIFRLKIPLD